MSVHPDQSNPSKFEQENPLAHMGTPAEMRTVNPIPPETQALRAQSMPKAPFEPVRARRHGLMGLMDSIAYRFQLVILSAFGTAELSREKDPIEQLKRRYGRAERKV